MIWCTAIAAPSDISNENKCPAGLVTLNEINVKTAGVSEKPFTVPNKWVSYVTIQSRTIKHKKIK